MRVIGAVMISRKQWGDVLLRVITTLDQHAIKYHVDASSSLYFQGVDFEMNDLDLTVEWGSIGEMVYIFEEYGPLGVSVGYPPSVRFYVEGNEVHILSYKSVSGIGESRDRVMVDVDGFSVWCKTIEFYKKNMGSKHRLHGPLEKYLESRRGA